MAENGTVEVSASEAVAAGFVPCVCCDLWVRRADVVADFYPEDVARQDREAAALVAAGAVVWRVEG